MVEVKVKDGLVLVKSDYNEFFIKRARTLQGKWKNPFWVFPEENEELVRATLLEVYGEDGRPCETVTVDLNLDEYDYDDEVVIDTIVVATRPGRDHAVKLSANVLLLKGEFKSSGGSTRYPSVTAYNGTVIRVKKLPRLLYEKIKNDPGVSLVDTTPEDKKKKLMEEKEKLLLRIREIDCELANL